MKANFTTAIFAIALCFQVTSQQWVDQQYQYDSVLNIPYGTAVDFNGNLDTLHMDVYTPTCTDTTAVSRWPLLLFVHGGAFIAGSKEDASIQQLCKDFAKRGYVTASVQYRLGFVSDEVAWNCNLANYSCLFATDTAEWIRAYYRGVQDTKGALRYLVNRYDTYQIDTANVFVAGESAGSFIAMGVGLLDVDSERPPETFALSDVPLPNANTVACEHNLGQVFTGTIAQPDLGGIDGDIEPTNINYTIKGIGNIFGGMFTDILANTAPGATKPAIYSFHQPCDLIVSIDSSRIFWGLSWCMTNGYGCFGIANTPKAYGSRVINNWNANNAYGYNIQSEFTTTNFPYNYLIGQGSCVDQVVNNNQCHAYDSKAVREANMAQFFANEVSSTFICQEVTTLSELSSESGFYIYPNPAKSEVTAVFDADQKGNLLLTNVVGDVLETYSINSVSQLVIDLRNVPSGMYFLQLSDMSGRQSLRRVVKL